MQIALLLLEVWMCNMSYSHCVRKHLHPTGARSICLAEPSSEARINKCAKF